MKDAFREIRSRAQGRVVDSPGICVIPSALSLVIPLQELPVMDWHSNRINQTRPARSRSARNSQYDYGGANKNTKKRLPMWLFPSFIGNPLNRMLE